MNISNTGPLTIAGGSVNNGTTTTISTTSPLTVATGVTSAGDLTLTAGNSAATGDNLSILAGVRVDGRQRDSRSRRQLRPGAALANIFAAGNISITVDAGNADPGVGGTADIRNGTLTAGSISLIGQGDGDTLLGGAAGENFFGGGGDDLIAAGGGNNAIDGGPGNNDVADYSAAPGGGLDQRRDRRQQRIWRNRRLRRHRERQWVGVRRHADRRRQCQHVPRQWRRRHPRRRSRPGHRGLVGQRRRLRHHIPARDRHARGRPARGQSRRHRCAELLRSAAVRQRHDAGPVRHVRRRQLHCVAGTRGDQRGPRQRHHHVRLPPGRRDRQLFRQHGHHHRPVGPYRARRVRAVRVHRRHGGQRRRRPLVDDLFYYARYHDVWTAHAMPTSTSTPAAGTRRAIRTRSSPP